MKYNKSYILQIIDKQYVSKKKQQGRLHPKKACQSRTTRRYVRTGLVWALCPGPRPSRPTAHVRYLKLTGEISGLVAPKYLLRPSTRSSPTSPTSRNIRNVRLRRKVQKGRNSGDGAVLGAQLQVRGFRNMYPISINGSM